MSDPTRIYQDNPFCREFTAAVEDCRPRTKGGWEAVLSRTAFFPEGGGQPCDLGTLRAEGVTANVLDVREADGKVVHLLDAPLPAGAAVSGTLDWVRRRDFMEQHTGEHILSGTLHRLYGAENVGFHIGPDTVRMDMSVELSAEQLLAAEREANAALREDTALKVLYPSREELAGLTYRSKKEIEGQVRLVEIPGSDCCACCGTHLARTGQVGLIKILSHQNYKGGTRLAVVCGQRAFEAVAAEHEILSAIAQTLSAKPETAGESVTRLLADNASQKAARVEAEGHWFEALAASTQPGKPCVLKVSTLNGDGLRRLCLSCGEKAGALTAVFCPGGQPGTLAYAITLPDGDARPACKALNERFGGRGGGKPALCQGSIAETEIEILREFFAER